MISLQLVVDFMAKLQLKQELEVEVEEKEKVQFTAELEAALESFKRHLGSVQVLTGELATQYGAKKVGL